MKIEIMNIVYNDWESHASWTYSWRYPSKEKHHRCFIAIYKDNYKVEFAYNIGSQLKSSFLAYNNNQDCIRVNSLIEAQEYMDKFLIKISKLMVFL